MAAISDVWAKFQLWTEQHGASAYLFRGQPNADPIRPKIGRPDYGYSKAREGELFQAFRRAARPFVQVAPVGDFEWLALAQHHGAPTRLLDWSTSPLVAAWFAVSSHPHDTDAKIYALDRTRDDVEAFDLVTMRSVRKNHGHVSPLDVTFDVYLLETAPVSGRITTQRGIFTLHGDPTVPLTVPPDEQFDIPAVLRDEFQGRLMELGIDASHVYPDLDGLCKALDWRFRTNKMFSAIA